MNHFYENIGENWFNYQRLYSNMVNRFSDGSKFVEVGTWKGRSASFMAVEILNSGKKIQFDCIDNWEYVDGLQNDIDKQLFGKDIYSQFLNNIEPVRDIINPIKSISWEAANLYDDASLDFIFIDAAHDYESVKKDIISWLPKLKKNGIIAGHDYTDDHPGVKFAVDELFSEVDSFETCWIYENKEKKISIIVPTYKRTELLKNALNSIQSQNYNNYEVIVCSDGYSDLDKECVLSFDDERFKYYHIDKSEHENWGHDQRNAMIKYCTGDYVFWLDDDNTIVSDYLEYANRMIKQDCGMCVFKINHNLAGVIPYKNEIHYSQIDTLNVMIRTDIACRFNWENVYEADFLFISDVNNYCLDNNIEIQYLDKIIGTHY